MHKFNHNTHGHFPSNHSGQPTDIVGYEITLKSKKQIAESTYAFIFEKPNGFKFMAGQHVRMTLIKPSETDSEGDSRFLSFASSPQESNLVFAMRMRDTAFKRVLGRMKKGDKVLMQMRLGNPQGSFALQNAADTSKTVVFLIGGIGIVPAFSMIKDALEKKLSQNIFLFYSNRKPEGAPFLDELENLAKQEPSFKLIATMTEPEKSVNTWRGETGKIDQSMLKKYLRDRESPIYYIAGMSAMVKAMKTLLTDSDVSEDNIRAEEFDGFTMNHKSDVVKPMWKSHLPIFAVIVVIAVIIILHVEAAISLFHNGFGGLSFTSPIVYVMLGLLIVIAIFKFKHFSSFVRSIKKYNKHL